MSFAPRSRFLPLLFVALAIGLASACDKGSNVGARPTTAGAAKGSEQTVGAASLAQKGGLCEENRTVSKPEPDSAEWVIWRLYELAQAEDNESNFKAFVDLFPTSRNPRELREMFWGRVRNTVHKFTKPGKPDFVICRSIATSDGRKYYIVTSDLRQTPPPITVGEADGRQKILFLTPF